MSSGNFSKKNLMIGGAILVGLYILNPYSSQSVLDDKNISIETSELSIQNFVGRVNMVASADGQLHVEIRNINKGLAPTFNNIAGRLEIQGSEKIKQFSCNHFSFLWWGNDSDAPNISVNGRSKRSLDEYPILEIKAPEHLKLTLDQNIIHGNFIDLESVDINSKACSDLSIGNIKNDATIKLYSDSQVSLNNILGNAKIDLFGNGNVTADDIAGNVELNVGGSGDINVADIGGTANISVRGSGGIEANDVAQDSVVSVNGSGQVTLDKLNGIAKMKLNGSGDIDVEAIYGDAELLVTGSGDIDVDDGTLNWLIARVTGSGSIDYNGSYKHKKVKTTGSGDINID